jgi:hypothetical protein
VAGYARQLVEAREEAEKADRRATARANNAAVAGDALAAFQGEDAMAARRQEQRAAEIAEQGGVGIDEARAMAANEADLESLLGLRQKLDGSQYQSSIGQVSDMQRIGGGGGVVASGIDYARQQADLQRQMVDLLRGIQSRTPEVTISEY